MVLNDENLYIGGRFDGVQGLARTNLAAIDLDGKVLAWEPEVNKVHFLPCYEYLLDHPDYHVDTMLEIGEVHSVIIESGVIEVTGDFYEANGEIRKDQAKFDLGGVLLAE